jgi:hypothetical protein
MPPLGPALRETPCVTTSSISPGTATRASVLAVGENRLRSLLLYPEERVFHRDWERAVASFVGAFRHSVADEVHDQRAVELVGELSLASGRFGSCGPGRTSGCSRADR